MEISKSYVADSLGQALQVHGRKLKVLQLFIKSPRNRNQDFLSRILRFHVEDLEEEFLVGLHTLILPRLTANSWLLFGKVNAIIE